MNSRAAIRRQRVDALIQGFDGYVFVHKQQVPFTRSGQFEFHDATIRQRRTLGSVSAALDDEAFLAGLVETLRAWGIGTRASRLVPFDRYVAELRRWRERIEALDGVRLGAADSSHGRQLWRMVDGVEIVENEARVVALTKTIHHLLPDLLPPIDRAYTGTFFGWSVPDFQSRQREIFDTSWSAFVEIGRRVDLDAHVGTAPWNTSCSKVVDNAIIGYCLQEGLMNSQNRRPAPRAASRNRRRDTWTIDQLKDDLGSFAEELAAAGLKPHSIDTYVGRADTFIRWLDGRYEPRGPNA